MEDLDFNSEGSALGQEDRNLQNVLIPEILEKQCFDEENKVIDQGLNGDPKSLLTNKSISPALKRKLQKFKDNQNTAEDINESVELPSTTIKLARRKVYDTGEVSSGESEEFNGFDFKDPETFETSNIILKKLIGD